MNTNRKQLAAATLCVLAGFPATLFAASLPEDVRSANGRFKDVSVAVKEGYAPIPCASGIEGGAMGVHYVNADLIKDEAINLAKPEAVMYEPGRDGKMAARRGGIYHHQGTRQP